MSGRQIQIAWEVEDTPEALREQYRRQEESEVRTRLHALWLLRTGWSMEEVAGVVGVHYRTVQRWVGWYRHGGIAEVGARHGGGHGQPSWLTPGQESAVAEEAAKGSFTTAAEVRRWVADQFGITYRPKGIYGLLRRVRCRPKVPRPSMSRRTQRHRKPGKGELRRSPACGRSDRREAPGLGR
jgi:transposase